MGKRAVQYVNDAFGRRARARAVARRLNRCLCVNRAIERATRSRARARRRARDFAPRGAAIASRAANGRTRTRSRAWCRAFFSSLLSLAPSRDEKDDRTRDVERANAIEDARGRLGRDWRLAIAIGEGWHRARKSRRVRMRAANERNYFAFPSLRRTRVGRMS